MSNYNLIPIYNTVLNTRKRRVRFMDEIEGWPKYHFKESLFRADALLTWIENSTKGRFYLTPQTVAFEDEKDFVLFKLSYKDE